MLKYISTAIGLTVFIGFMMLVGSPHVVETIIGLGLGCATGFGTYFKFKKKDEDYME